MSGVIEKATINTGIFQQASIDVVVNNQDITNIIDVQFNRGAELDVVANIFYIKSGEDEIDAYVKNISKPSIDAYVEDIAKPEMEKYSRNIIDGYVASDIRPQLNVYIEDASESSAAADLSKDLSKDWAIKTDSKVVENGEELDFSAKYYAEKANSDGAAQVELAVDQVALAEAKVIVAGEHANRAEESARIAAESAGAANVSLWSPQEQDHLLTGDEACGWLLAGQKTGLEHGVANQMIADAWAGGVPERLINRDVAVPFTTSTSGTAFNNVGNVHIRTGAGEFVHTLNNPTEYVFIRQSTANNIPYAKFSSMVISAVLEDGTTTVVHSFTPSDDNNEKTFEGILSFEKKITQIKLTGTVVNAGSGGGTSGMATPTMIVTNAFPYRKAANGWNIVDSRYKANVDEMFAATGQAPFYIRDAGDDTVWAPRYTKRELKYASYVDEGYGYSIYSDGWCEIQGCYLATIAVPANSGKTVTALLPFEIKMDNIRYIPTIQWVLGGTNYDMLASAITTKYKGSFNVGFWNRHNTATGELRGFTYKVSGYVSPETLQSFNISPSYTYYRIGNQIKDPQLILAQEALAQLNNLTNNKADKIAVEDASIFTAAGKEAITGWGKPNLELRVTKPTAGFVVESNGWLGVTLAAVGSTNSASVFSNGSLILLNDAGGITHIQVPVRKGQTITTAKTNNGSVVTLNFIPDMGA